jgi:ABC-type oligopeptide transport system substrate-binding subunit
VVYNLPYPGILPDNPLYFVKVVRDKAIEFVTRDNVKKAKLYLSYSDKRVSMAIKLAEKGKNKQALTTLSKGEKYFEKIPGLLKEAKERGQDPPQDLVLQLKLSNEKHAEVIQNMLKTFPQGQKQTFDHIIKINNEVKNELNQL